MRRPGAVVGFTLFGTLAIIPVVGYNAAVAMAVFMFVLCAASLFFRRLRHTGIVPLVLFAVACACLLFCVKFQVVAPVRGLSGRTAVLTGTIAGFPEKVGDAYCYRIKEASLCDGRNSQKLTVDLYTTEKLSGNPYDVLTTSVTFSEIQDNTRQHSYARGAYVKAFLNGDYTVSAVENRPFYDVDRLYIAALKAADYTGRVLDKAFSPSVAGMCRSLLLGDASAAGDDVMDSFRVTGVYHMIAVSGSHIVVLGQILMLVLSFFGIARKPAAGLALLGQLFFIAMAGFPYSAVRAGIMMVLYTLGLLIGRESDALNSLGLALLCILLYNPFAAMDVGLLMSALSCLGIILFSGRIYRAMIRFVPARPVLAVPIKGIYAVLAQTIPAWLIVIPVSVMYFEGISLIAPLANVLLSAGCAVLLATGFSAVLLSVIPGSLFITRPLVFLCGASARYMMGVTGVLAKIPYASVNTSYRYVELWIVACLVLLAVLLLVMSIGKQGRHHLIRMYALCCAVMLVAGMFSHALFYRGVTELYVADVGQGAAVVVCRGKRAMVIGCGGNKASKSVQTILTSRAIGKVDLLILPQMGQSFSSDAVDFIRHTKVDTVLSPSSGELYSQVKSAAAVYSTLAPAEEATVTLWGDVQVDMTRADCLWLTIGATKMLVALPGCTFSEQWDSADLLITTPAIPTGADRLSVPTALVSGPAGRAVLAEKSLAQYGVTAYSTAGVGGFLVTTRGNADITIRRMP